MAAVSAAAASVLLGRARRRGPARSVAELQTADLQRVPPKHFTHGRLDARLRVRRSVVRGDENQRGQRETPARRHVLRQVPAPMGRPARAQTATNFDPARCPPPRAVSPATSATRQSVEDTQQQCDDAGARPSDARRRHRSGELARAPLELRQAGGCRCQSVRRSAALPRRVTPRGVELERSSRSGRRRSSRARYRSTT